MNRQNIHYELTNHLGNVMATIRGAKIQNASGYGYRADIVSTTTYGVFGNTIEEWSYSSNSYKFGFNGMEKENELYGEGNAYTTMFRLYDARLGSWKSSDPLQNYFAPYSPYNFVFNNPIFWIDPEGLSPKKPGERNIFQKIFGRTSTGLKLVEPEKVTEVITYTKRNYLKPDGDKETFWKYKMNIIVGENGGTGRINTDSDDKGNLIYKSREFLNGTQAINIYNSGSKKVITITRDVANKILK